MTDEETNLIDFKQAEDYVVSQLKLGEHEVVKINGEYSIVWKTLEVEQAYLAGLAKGRKEKCIIEQGKDGTIKLCEIAKENEELKKRGCKNAYVVSDKNSDAIPCYTVCNCKNCPKRS